MSEIRVWFPHRLDSRPYDAVEKFFQNKHSIVSFKIMKQHFDRPFKSIFVHGYFIQEMENKSSSEKSSTQNPCVFLSSSVLQHKRIGRFYNLQHDALLVFFLFCRLNLTLMLTYGSVVSRTLENNHARIIQRQHLNLVLGTHCLLKLFQFPYIKGTFFHTCQSMESRYVIWLVYLRHVVLKNAIWLVRIQSAT